MEQLADVEPMVQTLDIPVPQGGDQLVEAFWDLDLPIPEQVIEAPKFTSSGRRSRKRPVPVVQQTAEQLVEVPTIVSVSSLRALVVFKFSQGQNSTAFVVQNMLTFQFCVVEVFKVYAQDRFLLLHPLTHLVLRMRFFRMVFRTYPPCGKKCVVGPHSGSELSADFTPSTPAAYEDSDEPPMWYDEDGNAWVVFWPVVPAEQWSYCVVGTLQGDEVTRLVFLFFGIFCPSLCNDRCPGLVKTERSHHASVHGGCWKNFWIACARCSYLEICSIVSFWPCI